jgi:6-phosphofructokinase 1
MKKKPASIKSTKRIGVLTAGGDSPGLNAAIRAVGKAAIGRYGWEVVGFRDGFSGLLEDRCVAFSKSDLAGILTLGGTLLGTSRVKPHRVEVGGETRDLRDRIVATCKRRRIDALVCLGGGGTHKNAARLLEKGLPIVSLPKTIDNDVALTDATIGFDTALGIATETIDRLHSTAHSHHRIILAEIMGHKAGWLALGAGIAGGADVILVPEIPYDLQKVAAAIRRRAEHGTRFSIVAVAEGARNADEARAFETALRTRKEAQTDDQKRVAQAAIERLEAAHEDHAFRLAHDLGRLTGLESRVTILGYVQRGGTPSFADRLLATRLGTAAVEFIAEGRFGMMVASNGGAVRAVPIKDVAKKIKTVPLDHSWFEAARAVGTALGD